MSETILPALGGLIVYKERPNSSDQGSVVPLFHIDNPRNIKTLVPIDTRQYPNNIDITKGYSQVESTYSAHDLFVLAEHRPKSPDNERLEYFSLGTHAQPLPVNTLLPVIQCALPPKETGQMPAHITPPKGTFFIQDGEAVYGPFTAMRRDDDGFVIESKVTTIIPFAKDTVARFHVKEVEQYVHEVNIDGTYHRLISSLHDLKALRHAVEDYTSDDKLIKQYSSMRFGFNDKLSKRDAERLAAAIQEAEKRQTALASDENLHRFKTILQRYLNETNIGSDMVRHYLGTSAGRTFLKEYVERHKATLLSSHIDEIEREGKRARARAEAEIEKLNREAAALKTEVEQARKQADAEIQAIIQSKNADIQNRMRETEEELSLKITQKEEQLAKVERELAEVLDDLKLARDVEILRREYQQLDATKTVLERSVEAFQEQLQNPNKLAASLGQMEAVSRAMRGGSALVREERQRVPVVISKTAPNHGKEIINHIRDYLDDSAGRTFTHNDMTNLVVCMMQSFLTVLAGDPGVGKTSTVIRLAEALHLGSTDGNSNFLYVPVSRGWVSGRDILGSYNSLNGMYQRARTGLYDFLSVPEAGDQEALRLILLDEANLSPLEHYWSDFIGMCDPEGRHRPIDTGHAEASKRLLSVPESTRFVATINKDSTTERLSPRLIDRAPVITLMHDAEDSDSPEVNVSFDGAIPFALCKQYFENHNNDEMPETLKEMYRTIHEILTVRNAEHGMPVSISHRKERAINDYCVVAGQLMDDHEVAFDYAVSQHILPHISGHGPQFRARLERLHDMLKDSKLHHSQTLLARVLENGNDFAGTYSYL
ncbi:AAA family ATPase [Marinobacterium sp. BA1]|uniref:AAA family ATPase n=1 Tax=Marinobacterium sp. BA1 TaxID=3138931 RepID=UPI0032E65A14